jgi:hypothetical protein
VTRVTWTPPADIGHQTRTFGVVVLVSSAQDTLPAGPRPVATLIDGERRAGFRMFATRTVRDTAPIVLRSLNGVPFTVTETGPATFGFPAVAGTTAASGVIATFDTAANPGRQLVVASVPPPPATPVSVTVRFRPNDVRLFGGIAASCTGADARRMIDSALRRSSLAIRSFDTGVRLDVRADGTAADLIASAGVLADAADQLRSGMWLSRQTLVRGANQIYARVRNVSALPEATVTWRLLWFDPAAAPIPIDAAHEIATGTASLPPGGELIVDGSFTPGAGGTNRGVIVLASSDGDPLRDFPATIADALALDVYCQKNTNAAYRVLGLPP